jgi:DNA-binding SARP family transcriptional activator
LRKLLHDLRQVLPAVEATLEMDHRMLCWRDPSSVIVDVATFSNLLVKSEQATNPQAKRAALEQALDLYAGELLLACYDDWVLHERERLHQQYLAALEKLSRLCAGLGDLNAALAHAQRLVQADPLQESAYRLLMNLHMESGDRARALRVYHTCATILAHELSVDPAPETQEIYQKLLNMESSAPPTLVTQVAAHSLVGRQREWESLLHAWQMAAQGEPRFVLIAGEAGIGKSRLAEEMMLWANDQSITAVHARAYAAEGSIVYAPVRDWLRNEILWPVLARLDPLWLSEIGRLLPELLIQRPDLPRPEPLTEQWQRQRLFEALAQVFAAVKAPLLLVLDDLQWCDRETLEWLHYLLRFDPKARLLVVGTVRSEEVDPQHALITLLLNLRSAGQLTEIELGPLDASDTTVLASQVAERELDVEAASRLYQATEGNPLFIVETVRAGLRSLGVDKESIGGSSPSHFNALSPKVQAVIQSRLAQLSPVARDLAQLAATIGREFRVDVLAQAGEQDEETLVYGLDELWRRRIVREQGADAYDFSHDRIREATYSDASLVRRRLLHRQVAQALEHVHAHDLDAVSGQIAVHYESAGLLENAVLYYQRAAEVAQGVYAHSETVHYLNKELELLHQLPITQLHLQQELRLQLVMGASVGHVLEIGSVGVKDAYVRALTLAMEVGDDRERLVAVAGLHIAELVDGHIQVAYELAKEGLSLAEKIGDPSGLVEAHGRLGTALFHLGQWRASRGYLEQAVAYTEYQWNSSSHLLWPLHQGVTAQRLLALVLWHLGYPAQAQENMTRALMWAEEVAHPYTLASALNWSAWLHQLWREVGQAQAMAEQTIIFCQQRGIHTFLPGGIITEGWALAQQGQIEAGIARIQEGIAARKAVGAQPDEGDLGSLAEVYGLAGQPDDGLQLLDEALEFVTMKGESHTLAELYRMKAELLQMQGADEQEVESCFLRSLAIAQEQEVKSLELRTSISLSRLWQLQGKRRQAHELLAGIYAWFTEGFDTHDLKEAAALLESWSRSD